METHLADFIRDTRDGREAEDILRRCALRLCTATCPTYQLFGDELDGLRGRIYLIKQVLEGAPPTEKTLPAPRPLPVLPLLREHLPSGVHYSRLLDIGREVVEQRVGRGGIDGADAHDAEEPVAARHAVRRGDGGQSVRLLLRCPCCAPRCRC